MQKEVVLCTVWNYYVYMTVYVQYYLYTVKPLFNESLGDWFSYIRSRFSLNGGYAK
jgi:hypothetical protein